MSLSVEKNAELAFCRKIKSKEIYFFSHNDYVRQLDYTKAVEIHRENGGLHYAFFRDK